MRARASAGELEALREENERLREVRGAEGGRRAAASSAGARAWGVSS